MSIYLRAINLSNQSTGDYDPYISVYPSDGESIESWAFVMRDKRNGDLLAPAKKPGGSPYSDLIVSPSENLDSFRLVRISSPDNGELRIIFDKSRWPVIVTDNYAKWYDLGYTPIGWKEISKGEIDLSIIKKEAGKEVLISTDIEDLNSWPEITIEQLPDYLRFLKEYVKENIIFPDNATNIGSYRLVNREWDWTIFFDHTKRGLYQDHNFVPRKTISGAILKWDIPNTSIHTSRLLFQVWLDEPDEPSIIFTYLYPCEDTQCLDETFLSIFNDLTSGFAECTPSYPKKTDSSSDYIPPQISIIESGLEIFHVKELLEKWNETQIIPRELENKLFFVQMTPKQQ